MAPEPLPAVEEAEPAPAPTANVVLKPRKFAPLDRRSASAVPMPALIAAAAALVALLIVQAILRLSIKSARQRRHEERLYRAVQEVKEKAQIAAWKIGGPQPL